MLRSRTKILSVILGLAILFSTLAIVPAGAASTSGITDAAGWFESAYAEWAPIANADSYNAYISNGDSTWSQINSALIRKYSSYYRVDEVGLKPGEYSRRYHIYRRTGRTCVSRW